MFLPRLSWGCGRTHGMKSSERRFLWQDFYSGGPSLNRGLAFRRTPGGLFRYTFSLVHSRATRFLRSLRSRTELFMRTTPPDLGWICHLYETRKRPEP